MLNRNITVGNIVLHRCNPKKHKTAANATQITELGYDRSEKYVFPHFYKRDLRAVLLCSFSRRNKYGVK